MIEINDVNKLSIGQKSLIALPVRQSYARLGLADEKVVRVLINGKQVRFAVAGPPQTVKLPAKKYGGSQASLTARSTGTTMYTFELSLSNMGVTKCRRCARWWISAWLPDGGYEACAETKEGIMRVRVSETMPVFWSLYTHINREGSSGSDGSDAGTFAFWRSRMPRVAEVFPEISTKALTRMVDRAEVLLPGVYGYGREYRRLNALNKAVFEVLNDKRYALNRLPLKYVYLLTHDMEGSTEELRNHNWRFVTIQDGALGGTKTEEYHVAAISTITDDMLNKGSINLIPFRQVEPDVTIERLRELCKDAPCIRDIANRRVYLIGSAERRPKTWASVEKQLAGYSSFVKVLGKGEL